MSLQKTFIIGMCILSLGLVEARYNPYFEYLNALNAAQESGVYQPPKYPEGHPLAIYNEQNGNGLPGWYQPYPYNPWFLHLINAQNNQASVVSQDNGEPQINENGPIESDRTHPIHQWFENLIKCLKEQSNVPHEYEAQPRNTFPEMNANELPFDQSYRHQQWLDNLIKCLKEQHDVPEDNHVPDMNENRPPSFQPKPHEVPEVNDGPETPFGFEPLPSDISDINGDAQV